MSLKIVCQKCRDLLPIDFEKMFLSQILVTSSLCNLSLPADSMQPYASMLSNAFIKSILPHYGKMVMYPLLVVI